MIALYYWPTPNGHKASIALEEMGLAYETHPVNILRGEQLEADFLAVNPNHRIPAITDPEGPGGEPLTLFESGAILTYLAEKCARFWPTDPRDRHITNQWLMFQMANVGPMFGQCGHFKGYAPEPIPYAIERYTNETLRLYGVMDGHLANTEYLAGEYSIADMATWPWDHATRGNRPRVFFGDDWVRKGVLELVRDDISRFRAVLPMDPDEPLSSEQYAAGTVPKLSAMALHNGTIYRWNRPCYGVVDGVPHLRIENRPLPAGPTAVDGIANAAFLFGLTLHLAKIVGDVTERMPFHDCQANFYNAASNGLRASLLWLDGRSRPADELALQLLPMAAEGLREAKVDDKEIDRLLDTVAARVSSGRTGARWLLSGFNALNATMPKDEANQALVSAYLTRQRSGAPVHEWGPPELPDRDKRRAAYQRVGQIMTTDLITVEEHDIVTLAEAKMRWEAIRHIPVEDEGGRLVGMLSTTELLKALRAAKGEDKKITVGEVMQRDPVSLTPETPTLEAIKVLREHDLSGIPVVRQDKLVGILTEADFLTVAERLLQ